MKSFLPQRGFTLIEILVVVGIISILSAVIFGYARASSQTSRDIKRQSDLRSLQSAVELYKQKNGRYPAGCNGAYQWSGELGGPYACGGNNTQYITGISPEFIPVLPRDPKRNSGEGYAYVTNTEGSVYKIMAMGTVEGEIVSYKHPFKSCDFVDNPSNDIRDDGYCGALYSGNSLQQTESNTGHQCNAESARFKTSYALWGGYAALQGTSLYAFPGDCYSGWCLNTTPPNRADDPLDVFISGGTLSTSNNPSGSIRNTLRVKAVYGTTQILCK